MKLLKAHIENFGKLSNVDFEFDNLFVLQKENGFGKTTLSIFLKAMFYSMQKKGNNKAFKMERSKYKPWQGGVYGGYVIFEIKGKKYKLTRTFADTPEGDTFELVDLTTGLVSKDFSIDIGLELFGCGEETFLVTAFFPQLSFEGGLTDEMRANMTGLNKFENDLNNLSNAQKIILTKSKEIRSAKVKSAQIEEQKYTCRNIESLIENQRVEIDELKNTILFQEEKLSNLKKEQREELSIQNKNYNYVEQKSQAENQLLQMQSKLNELLLKRVETPKQEQCKQSKYTTENPRDKKRFLALSVLSILFIITGVIVAGITKLSNIINIITFVCLSGLGIISEIMLLLNYRRNNKNNIQKVEKDEENVNEDYKQQIEQLKLEIEDKKNEIQNRFLQNIDLNRTKLENLNMQVSTMEKELAITKMKLLNLNNDHDANCEKYQYMQSQLSEIQNSQLIISEKQNYLEKTLAFLEQAKQNVSIRFMEPMKQAFESLFNIVSSDKKGEVSLDINLNASISSANGNKEYEYLSQGYKDIVSICQRIALLDDVYKEEKPFILLDDPFVNLDDKKMEIMKKLITKLSQKYQIIYLHCHSRCSIN